jgi:DNA recombination protein RmuC
VADLIKIGKKIDETKRNIGAMNKLVKERKPNYKCGKTKRWGAKAKKSLPEKILARAEQDENQLLN